MSNVLTAALQGYTYSTNLTLPYSEAPTVAEVRLVKCARHTGFPKHQGAWVLIIANLPI